MNQQFITIRLFLGEKLYMEGKLAYSKITYISSMVLSNGFDKFSSNNN